VSLAYAQGGSRVTGITYPDAGTVAFAYLDAGAPGRISRRTDRRGFATSFTFDAAGTLASVTSAVGGGKPDVQNRFAASEGRGLATSVDAANLYTLLDGPRSDVADRTRIWIDRLGQPTRVEDPFGALTRFFRTNTTFPTLVTRTVAANGAAAAATYDGRGNVLTSTDSATYRDAGGTRTYATARYAWDPTWNEATKVVDPEQNASPVADSVTAAYDSATGNRLWSRDALGRTATYEYDAASRLLTAMVSPEGHRTALGYDGRGNLRWVETPLGVRTTYHRDSIGRVVKSVAPLEGGTTSVDSTTYDVMDRALESRTIAPPTNYVQQRAGDGSGSTSKTLPAAVLVVSHTYDAEGNRLSTTRGGQPMPTGIGALTTSWTYDGLGRVLTETASDGRVDAIEYDPAGNAVRRTTRRGHVVRSEYDAVGRLIRKTVPEVDHGRKQEQPAEARTWHFPRYAQDAPDGPMETVNQGGHTLVLEREISEYTYDVMGNLRSATNPWARVSRGWNPNGTLAADTLQIATYASGFGAGEHVYATAATYDLSGRPTALRHPAPIAPRVGGVLKDTEAYEYHGDGKLRSVTDVLGNRFAYEYHPDGAVRSLLTPTGYLSEWTYDGDGRLRSATETLPREMEVDGLPTTVLHRDSFRYDLRGKMTDARTRTGRVMNRYSGLGHLVWHRTEEGDWDWGADESVALTAHDEEEYTLDALANYQQARSSRKAEQADVVRPSTRSYTYQASTGRLSSLVGNRDRADLEPFYTGPLFDEAGNTVREDYAVTARKRLVTWNYYDAEDRLRVLDRRICLYSGAGCSAQAGAGEETSTFEEHRYDALGRRVFSRTRQDLDCTASPGCDNTARRFVWNGDALLYEIRALGHTGAGSAMERDTGLALPSDGGKITGRVAYTNGPGIDRPLNFIRMNFSAGWNGPEAIYPHRNWRGQIDRLSFVDGTFQRCKGEPGPPATWGATLQDCLGAATPASSLSMIYGGADRIAATWIGGQLDNMRDASGKLYMRHRFYDPLTGQFTQEDPIGLAGGVNLYGFANGDPATYRDPYGLTSEECCPQWLVDASAGFGDAASFGLTNLAREYIVGGNENVDKSSGAYISGSVAGAVAITVATSGAGSAGNGARATTLVDDAARGAANVADDAAVRAVPRQIPATGPRVTPAQSKQIQQMGNTHGCHTCGARQPGGNGTWVGDHQLPTGFNPAGRPQTLQPQCHACSRTQGGWVSSIIAWAQRLGTP
jgi:RHS repeat-associated protein